MPADFAPANLRPAKPRPVKCSPADLDDTVTARWRRRLAGVRPECRHWRTRTAYYAAVSRLLTAGELPLAWSDVIEAVQPRGSRSTFYEVAGAHAKHSLIGDLLAQEAIDLMQIALHYRRTAAVDQLIDEAKVWTYWPYRERWSRRSRSERGPHGQASVDSLLATVADWARCHPGLAVALRCAPPICAVEDLLLLRPGKCSAVYALDMLGRVIQEAIDGLRPDVGAPVGASTCAPTGNGSQ